MTGEINAKVVLFPASASDQ